MHRFYLPPAQDRGDLLTLSDAEAHHAAQVLRLRPGDRITVLDGAGTQLLCEVEEVQRRRVEARVLEKHLSPPLPFQLTLVQALPKGKIFESIIQKATELGVTRIVPLVSQRVVAHFSNESAATKAAKWQAVAVEAIKQCGATWLPTVDTPVTLRQFVDAAHSFDCAMIGSLQPGSRHPREVFAAYTAAEQRLPRSICIWVGPEGDFTAEETQAVVSAGAQPITLGPLVLRVETAAIYCLSIVNYEMRAPRASID